MGDTEVVGLHALRPCSLREFPLDLALVPAFWGQRSWCYCRKYLRTCTHVEAWSMFVATTINTLVSFHQEYIIALTKLRISITSILGVQRLVVRNVVRNPSLEAFFAVCCTCSRIPLCSLRGLAWALFRRSLLGSSWSPKLTQGPPICPKSRRSGP